MAELKPCPFCGEEAELSSGKFYGKDTSYVICKRCGSQGEFFIVNPKYASAERAIEAWNRRQPQRMRGRWQRFPSDSELYKCSACYAWGEKAYKFCPWCGAEMEGQDETD